jgi:hypothetical protein
MPTATYTPLANVTLGTTASSVTFSSIPATYRDLIVVANGKFSSSNSLVRIRVGNGSLDTGSNFTTVYANSVPESESATETFWTLGRWNNVEGTMITHIMDYSATDKHKTALSRRGSASFSNVQMNASRWANTAVINILSVLSTDNTFAAGSTFNLYGVIA